MVAINIEKEKYPEIVKLPDLQGMNWKDILLRITEGFILCSKCCNELNGKVSPFNQLVFICTMAEIEKGRDRLKVLFDTRDMSESDFETNVKSLFESYHLCMDAINEVIKEYNGEIK